MITSLQHPLVKHWFLLRSERTYREETQRLLLVGEKMIRELSSEIPLLSLATLHPEEDLSAQEKFLVSESVLKKITGLGQPDGFAAEVALPAPQDLTDKQSVLILDRISDPGNLGTLLRTALALGWEGVALTPGTVDPFNDKALRAAKGATFSLPYARLTEEELVSWIREKKIGAFTADIEGEPLDSIAFTAPMALILSNEAEGPGAWTEPVSRKITISMDSKVESLNVAASGAILLYTMRRSP